MSTQKNEHNWTEVTPTAPGRYLHKIDTDDEDEWAEEFEFANGQFIKDGVAWVVHGGVWSRITPPTDTTGSGREGETGCGPKSGHCAECGTTEGALVLLEDTTLCEECNMADHVVKLRLIDELTARVEALRRDGERIEWLEKQWEFHVYRGYEEEEVTLQLVEGNVNDREYRKVGTGESLRAAIDSAQRQDGR